MDLAKSWEFIPCPRLGSCSGCPGLSRTCPNPGETLAGMGGAGCAPCDPSQSSCWPPLQVDPQIPRNPLFPSIPRPKPREGSFCLEGSSDLHNFSFFALTSPNRSLPLPFPLLRHLFLFCPYQISCFVPTEFPGCCTRSWSPHSIPSKIIGNPGVRPHPTSPVQAPSTSLGADFLLLLLILVNDGQKLSLGTSPFLPLCSPHGKSKVPLECQGLSGIYSQPCTGGGGGFCREGMSRAWPAPGFMQMWVFLCQFRVNCLSR